MPIEKSSRIARLRGLHAILLAAIVCGMGACGAVTPRGNGGTDGSARWALAIAEPRLTSFAADAELREIIGSGIALDGRLGTDTGAWSLVAYSTARAQTLQVTVDARGNATSAIRDAAPPGPGVVRPLPAGWADSVAVFAAIRPHLSASVKAVGLAALNAADYGGDVAGQAAWGVSFDQGPNHLVRWDGKYVGPQGAALALISQ